MIMTNEERLAIVALFNAQDAGDKLRREVINVNGVDITCYETGEIEKLNRHTGKLVRTFGGVSGGYMTTHADRKSVSVHRLIALAFLPDYSESLTVDHINGDKEDNSVDNLRMLTQRDNMLGFAKKRKGKSSIYRGVCRDRRNKALWIAQTNVNGKVVHLGRFDTELKAALAFDDAARKNGYLAESLNF